MKTNVLYLIIGFLSATVVFLVVGWTQVKDTSDSKASQKIVLELPDTINLKLDHTLPSPISINHSGMIGKY